MSAVVVVLSWSAGGCGLGPTVTDPGASETLSPAVTASSPTSVVTATAGEASSTSASMEPGSSQSEIARLFAELTRELAPLPVYGLEELPAQASIPAEWWPAASTDSPSAYDGPQVPNPWVSDSPPGTQEAQVLLKLGDGWLMVIENLRGDLGDVQGDAVGNVAGRPATLYELPGGVLVQWSDQGAWYGVFGRGVDADTVVRTALSLSVSSPAD
jgi:hypothetical protein